MILRQATAEAEMVQLTKGNQGRERVLSIVSTVVITLVTLVAVEIFLRIADFRELRSTLNQHKLGVDYDADLGWAPVPGTVGTINSFRITHFKHNGLGLRDEEFVPMPDRPSCLSEILLCGDWTPRRKSASRTC